MDEMSVRETRQALLAASYLKHGGVLKAAAGAEGVDPRTIEAAIESKAGRSLIRRAIEREVGVVEEAIGVLRAAMKAETVTRDGEVVADHRTRVYAAGKVIELALVIEKEASGKRGVSEESEGRLLTAAELMAMAPKDRVAAVMERRRVMVIEEERGYRDDDRS